MKLKSVIIPLFATVIIGVSSCDNRQGWSIDGTIKGVEGKRIALQAFNNNNWYTIDSLTVNKNGEFKYQSANAAAYPEVYRLSIEGNDIYFPVDSIETITFTSDMANPTAYKLAGSKSAEDFVQIDSMIRATVAQKGEAVAANDSLLKRNLSQMLLDNEGILTAYYIINKRIGGKALFDVANSRDRALIGAVAQRFDTERPDDPRAQLLKNMYLSARIAANPALVSENNIEIPESSLPADIVLYDNRGQKHSFYDTVSKGHPVLLSFTSYSLENSPAYNVILADIYNQYHDKGLEIYQVSFDTDEVEWKQSAVNMPWITVWNSPADGTAAMLNYNVSVLPLTYVINDNGEMTKRIEDPTTLASEVAKVMR